MLPVVRNTSLIRGSLFLLGLIFLMSPSAVHSQQNDFGVWASVAVRHKITQRLTATVEEQLRLNQNATGIAQYFTDAGLDFAISKKIKFALCYRFSNSNEQTYYAKRHRVYADLSYKTSLSSFEFLLRTRLQEQQEKIKSSDEGCIPEWYSRNKVTTKININKKYVPYLAVEAFYLISKPNSEGGFVDKMRYMAGAEYEFNRMHTLDLYYLIQKDYGVNDPVTDFVVGVGYLFTF